MPTESVGSCTLEIRWFLVGMSKSSVVDVLQDPELQGPYAASSRKHHMTSPPLFVWAITMYIGRNIDLMIAWIG